MAGSTETKVFTIFGSILDEGERTGFSLSALCSFLAALGVSEEASRLALSRMARKGYLFTRRKGRSSYHFLTDAGNEEVDGTAARTVFRKEAPPWDGGFRLVSYELPDSRRGARLALAGALKASGLGRVSPGLWASPYEPGPELRAILDSPACSAYVTEFRAEPKSEARAFAARIFGLAELGARMLAFIDLYGRGNAKLSARMAGSSPPGPAESFRLFFEGMTDYIDLLSGLPPLPRELLPADWPGARAEEVFRERRGLVRAATNEFINTVYIPFGQG
jgi:phenylacetic acid degradation operon negative regulatory protein